MTVADDLATLRTTISGYSGTPLKWPDRREALDALDRVEAEIAQLVRSRDMYVEQCDEARAEAERLRDGLESADRLLRAVPIDRLAPVTKRIVGEARAAIALALLAEDGAAKPAWGPDHPSYDEMGQ